jgi:aspartate kinase
MVATSEVSVSLTIEGSAPMKEICEELGEFSEVTMETGQAIVCLVGENIRYTPGVAARVFNALTGVNVRMISQGASLLNLSIIVAEEDLRKAVESLHTAFFSELDPGVFE